MFKKIIKFMLKLIPFKKNLFLVIRLCFKPSQNLFQHLTFKGYFKVLTGKGSFKIHHTETIIENNLFWKGVDGFEPHSLKIWEKLCRNADTIFDVGANSGIYSLIAKAENPSSKVYAFEPVERVFKFLERNVSLNNYDVICSKKAISNTCGNGFFVDDYEDFTQTVTINMDLEAVAKFRGIGTDQLYNVEATLITLDTFIKENNISCIDLMKIDVETHEAEVLEGFEKGLKDFKPTLLIEIIRDHVAASLEEQLDNLGYNFFYINEPFGGQSEQLEGEIYQKVESLIGANFGNYLICTDDRARELNLM